MALEYHRTAFKHGVSREQIAYVIENCPEPLDQPEEQGSDLVIFLWDDWRGYPLEVGAIEPADGGLLVIHAMRRRPKYEQAYARMIQRWAPL